MIRFIWQNWWRRKERFILLIIGAFIVSAGLTYLIGLSETNKGTIVDTLQKRWSASYDIVVRPEGTRSVTEDKQLLEPNYLSGLSGGISLEQYETIKDIPGVEVAAPIAMIGYVWYDVDFGQVELQEEGIYRRVMTKKVNNGLQEETESNNYYFPYNVWDIANKGPEYGVGDQYLEWLVSGESLLAGIDPEQEAKLVGLDKAIIDIGSSRYFSNEDKHYVNESTGFHELPIIVNQHSFLDKMDRITFEKLDIGITKENAYEVMEDVKENGGASYLDTIDGQVVDTFSVSGEEAFRAFVNKMTGVDWETGEVLDPSGTKENSVDSAYMGVSGIVYKPSPLEYSEISSPYPDRWPYSYQVVPVQNGEDAPPLYQDKESYREPVLTAEDFMEMPRIRPDWIGFYDTANLSISKDPTTELPMETYRPATAEYVMDQGGNPINPPKQLKPTGDPYNFLTDPPGMLTTIEAAEAILGDEPISSIRIKVAGVADLGDESQVMLEQVAREIEEKTGLITDITLGSSPQLALTYVPGLNGQEDIGWLQQPWVNIGSSISIFKETKIGFSGVVASVIAVAIIYVWASGIVSLLARRKEFAVLLSIGWRPSRLSRLLFIESSLIGLFVALISWMMLGFVYVSSDATITFDRFLWTGLFGLMVYVLGSFIPMLMTRNISPYEAMRTGEIAGKGKQLIRARGINRMAFNHFIGKWKRSFLSVISIALPTALLAVFLYITFRLRGVMYTSLLGEYVALEIGPAHYVAIIVSLVIAILTTAEITWQNVTERREEISLLQAIGWRRWQIRRLILAEGVLSGLFAACIGLTIAFLMIWGLYGAFPGEEIGFILATGLIPIVIGLVGTIFPAERAVRITPNQGMGGNITNRRTVEKWMKWVVIGTSVVLVGGFLVTMIQIAPNIEQAKDLPEAEQTYSPTEGDVSGEVPIEKEEDGLKNDESPKQESGEYPLEFNADQTTNDVGWGNVLFYTAKEVESTLGSPEAGMKHIAIEFTFEVLDHMSYEILPKRYFTIVDGEESYFPEKVTIIEAVGWEEERYLEGRNDGKLQAVLEFTVPETIDKYGLLLRAGGLSKGAMIWFE
ncbi:ABC transporter permease [Ornithinibacillus scapharcae]|uniref:ABC transporter permease n=1 Tax=Ornithinibacillus scapharcae TaxID=1147159 RepID=UPI000225BB4E|nr:FtsX-like permease family protein [Ornithinibacillus scapharcae]